MTTYETISLITNCSLFGIRFFWDYARRFLKYPVSELIGDYVFLEELWGSEAEFIVEEIKSADGISEMIERKKNFSKGTGSQSERTVRHSSISMPTTGTV